LVLRGSVGATVTLLVFVRLVAETKRRTPDGMLLNTAFSRVPKSARPGRKLVASLIEVAGRINPDSEL
jgi:hypothetical protein